LVKLRTFKESDAHQFHKLAHSSEDIQQYLPGVVRYDEEETALFVELWSKDQLAFIIENNKHKAVGAILTDHNYIYNGLNVYYFLGKNFRGKKYMKKALEQFIGICQNETHFDYLLFDVEATNSPSRKLVKSLGAECICHATNLFDFETYRIEL
jgi:RimJ/RimL family protein N-acetyltransferase